VNTHEIDLKHEFFPPALLVTESTNSLLLFISSFLGTGPVPNNKGIGGFKPAISNNTDSPGYYRIIGIGSY